MAKSTPIQTAFNGGELSPLMSGRVDVSKYAAGCKRLVNFLSSVEGPAFARAGTIYVGAVKTSANRTWLLRFEFSATDSYILEVGDQYIRFKYNRAEVVASGVVAYNGGTAYVPGDLASRLGVNYYCKAATTGNQPPNATYWHPLTGTTYEIPSPFAGADLTNADGTFALRAVQTGDVVYLVHPDYAPRKLSRYSGTRWTLDAVDFSPPPFKDENTTTTTIYASAKTGSGVTLTASAAVFTTAHVGQYIKLTEKDVRDVEQWEAGKAVIIGDIRRSDGKNYSALNAATTGSVKPTHSTGAAYDGDGAVQWQFDDPGYGWIKVTGYSSATVVTGTVISQLPAGAVGAGNPTTRWNFQAWNATDGYPTACTFFRERLVFARDETLWFSVSGDFENFATEIDGQITADAGFERTLSSDRNNSIQWLSPGDVLLVGTVGDEWAISKATTTEAFGPANCEAKRQSTYGSSSVNPQRVGSETLFMQSSGVKARAMKFQITEDGFESPDLCAYSRHILKPGVVDMAYQQEPWSVLWCVRSDGVLAGMTFSREQEVFCWHRHLFDGGVVECVECIPSPDGTRDDLWLIVRYTINGSTKRYIAYLADDADEDTAQEDWKYADMMLTYDGAPATTISGLGHLEGEEVWVLADGARHPNRTVASGAITLQLAASVVQVGLPCDGILETMDLEGGSATGSAQGKTRRANVVTLRLYNSLGGRAGPDDDNLTEIRYRTPAVPMGSAPEPFTGDAEIEWPGDYEKTMQVVVVKDRPMPMTLVAVMPQLVVQDGR
ncbi:MAG: hypothetical protein RLZZ373_2677 [Pseudomonadota bacterium]